ncbi:hypothetical protein MTO96_007568 [Rhipicephalus appendiculatus]
MSDAKDSFVNSRQRQRHSVEPARRQTRTVRSRQSSASPERPPRHRQDFSDMDANVKTARCRARSSNVGSRVAATAEGGNRALRRSTTRQEPVTATGKGKERSLLREQRHASPTRERYEMGDTTCFVAKAGDEAAASQNERYGPPNVSLNWHSERRPVPMARSRQQPSTASLHRDQGVAGGADGLNPDRWSSSSSVTVEVVQRGAPRPAERRTTMTPSIARHGKPPSTGDSSAADAASSMEISSAVALTPGSPGKRAINIDIEFSRPTTAGSSRGLLLRSISTNVEKIIGRLLAPPCSDSRSQLIRGPPGPPRGAYVTPWQVPRGYMPRWRPEQPVWDPNARAWRVPRGAQTKAFRGPRRSRRCISNRGRSRSRYASS